MTINDLALDQVFSDLKNSCGGLRNDYFGLLYLEQEFGIERGRAISQVAFGGNDYGVDGFHFDRETRNLYIFQFKYSEAHAQFKDSFQRLIDKGIEQFFQAPSQDRLQNQLLQKIKSCLVENEALIERVLILFIFLGDPDEAERSKVLDRLREELENKQYFINQRFGRPVTLAIEFRSAKSHKVGATSVARKSHTYEITLEETIARPGPAGEKMTIGFVSLADLVSMYRAMGQRFFERNIRSSLSEEKSVNRSIQKSIKNIVLDGSVGPEAFAFHHNGVTLHAEHFQELDGKYKVTEPRLLNGAQTVSTCTKFLEANINNKVLSDRFGVLGEIRVLCRIITDAKPEFVTAVTISNNRQNPVEPWNLHANDMIQLALQDRFREELGIYYERQEHAFENLSDESLEESKITNYYKAIELKNLTRTYLASDGDIDKFSRFKDVFEDDRIYGQVFSETRLKGDLRHVILCYKIQFRIRRLAEDIVERGVKKYGYVSQARNMLWALLCQAVLNDIDLELYSEMYGQSLTIEAQFTEWLSSLATTRCRFLFSDLAEDKAYAEKSQEGEFNFLRTNAAYKRAMQKAHGRWKWVEKRL